MLIQTVRQIPSPHEQNQKCQNFLIGCGDRHFSSMRLSQTRKCGFFPRQDFNSLITKVAAETMAKDPVRIPNLL